MFNLKYVHVKECLENDFELRNKFGYVYTIEDEDDNIILWIECENGDKYVDKVSLRSHLKKKRLRSDKPHYKTNCSTFTQLLLKSLPYQAEKIIANGYNEVAFINVEEATKRYGAFILQDKYKLDFSKLGLKEYQVKKNRSKKASKEKEEKKSVSKKP